jgi:hypothetical protein
MHLPTKDHFCEKSTIASFGNHHRIFIFDPSDEGTKSGNETPSHGGRAGDDSTHGLVSVE